MLNSQKIHFGSLCNSKKNKKLRGGVLDPDTIPMPSIADVIDENAVTAPKKIISVSCALTLPVINLIEEYLKDDSEKYYFIINCNPYNMFKNKDTIQYLLKKIDEYKDRVVTVDTSAFYPYNKFIQDTAQYYCQETRFIDFFGFDKGFQNLKIESMKKDILEDNILQDYFNDPNEKDAREAALMKDLTNLNKFCCFYFYLMEKYFFKSNSEPIDNIGNEKFSTFSKDSLNIDSFLTLIKGINKDEDQINKLNINGWYQVISHSFLDAYGINFETNPELANVYHRETFQKFYPNLTKQGISHHIFNNDDRQKQYQGGNSSLKIRRILEWVIKFVNWYSNYKTTPSMDVVTFFQGLEYFANRDKKTYNYVLEQKRKENNLTTIDIQSSDTQIIGNCIKFFKTDSEQNFSSISSLVKQQFIIDTIIHDTESDDLAIIKYVKLFNNDNVKIITQKYQAEGFLQLYEEYFNNTIKNSIKKKEGYTYTDLTQIDKPDINLNVFNNTDDIRDNLDRKSFQDKCPKLNKIKDLKIKVFNDSCEVESVEFKNKWKYFMNFIYSIDLSIALNSLNGGEEISKLDDFITFLKTGEMYNKIISTFDFRDVLVILCNEPNPDESVYQQYRIMDMFTNCWNKTLISQKLSNFDEVLKKIYNEIIIPLYPQIVIPESQKQSIAAYVELNFEKDEKKGQEKFIKIEYLEKPKALPAVASVVDPKDIQVKIEQLPSRKRFLPDFKFTNPLRSIPNPLRSFPNPLSLGRTTNKGGKKTQKRNLKLSTSTSRKRNKVRKQTHSRLPDKLKISHKKVARKYKSLA